MENRHDEISGATDELSSSLARIFLQTGQLISRETALIELWKQMGAKLEAHRLLSQENFEQVLRHPSPLNLLTALNYLAFKRMFTQENLSNILVHPEPHKLAMALVSMQESGCLNALTRQHLLRAGTNPGELSLAFSSLAEANLLADEELIEAVSVHPQSKRLAFYVLVLTRQGIYSRDNFITLSRIPDLIELGVAIGGFAEMKILSQEYFDLLVRHPYPNRLVAMAGLLSESHLLTDANLRLLLEGPQDLLTIINLDDDELINLLFASPRVLTQELFVQMLDAATQANPKLALTLLFKENDEASMEAPRAGLGR